MTDPMEQPQALYDDEGGSLPLKEVKKRARDADVQKSLDQLKESSVADAEV